MEKVGLNARRVLEITPRNPTLVEGATQAAHIGFKLRIPEEGKHIVMRVVIVYRKPAIQASNYYFKEKKQTGLAFF